MSRRPWWEWDAAELKFSTEVPAGYQIDYYEKPHGKDLWRKYLVAGKPCISVTETLEFIDDGKSGGMSYSAGRIWLAGVATLPKTVIDTLDPTLWETELQARKLLHRDEWGAKADLGTAVHNALEELCAGTVPSLGDFAGHVRPYVQAVCAWFADNDPEVVKTEMLVASREHSYAGRFDLLYKQNDQLVLADLKTSKEIRPQYLIQLAAYALAMGECGYGYPNRLEVIHARPDGSYTVTPSTAVAKDFLDILAAYRAYHVNKDALKAA